MRRPEDDLLDPKLAETLRAIDATLAGEPVDPRFADVAELSLLLRATRSEPPVEFTRELDQRLAARLVARVQGGRARPWLRSWSPGTFGAASAAMLAVSVAVVALVLGGGAQRSMRDLRAGPAQRSLAGVPQAAKAPAPAVARRIAPAAAGSGSATPSITGSVSSSNIEAQPLQPPPNGRKIIQSATLYLGAPAPRVDDVAQEVFNVVGSVNGIVDHSSVTSTGGPDGIAQFALRVPSGSLTATMSALSRLRYASVVSRTDSTEDVNTRFVDANRELADAQALRTTLVKQLAGATSQQQTDSLKAQLAAAEARIASARATIRNLNRQVDYSQVSLTIQAEAGGGTTSGGGFSLRTAAHDALRVLIVALGVALIAVAVLIPAVLLAAIGWWTATTVRRRRREQALELV